MCFYLDDIIIIIIVIIKIIIIIRDCTYFVNLQNKW